MKRCLFFLLPLIALAFAAVPMEGHRLRKRDASTSHTMSDHDKPWGYHKPDILPENWGDLFPLANGKRQSPIDIKEGELKKDCKVRRLQFNYNPHEINKVSNNGHSVTFSADGKSSILTGGATSAEFRLLQFHFHWGKKDDRGSEHTLNGKEFSAEVHLVHLNTKYASFAEALSHGDGLCVVGAFLEADDSGAESLDKVGELISHVKHKGDSHTFDGGFDARTLLPDDREYFSSYDGSLTTPPLSECVLWINMLKPVKISRKTLEIFRDLHALEKGHGKQKLFDNFRPPQPLHNRDVCLHQ